MSNDHCLAVLHCLLQHPDLKVMLSHSGALVEYLRQNERCPEADLDGYFGATPDSQEAAELAEIAPEIERILAELDLTNMEKTIFKEGFAAAFPDFWANLSLFLPMTRVGDEACNEACPWPHPSWLEGLPPPRALRPGELLGNKDKKLALRDHDPYAEACAAAAENGTLEEYLEQVAYELSGGDKDQSQP